MKSFIYQENYSRYYYWCNDIICNNNSNLEDNWLGVIKIYFKKSKLKQLFSCLQPIIVFIGVQVAISIVLDIIPLKGTQWIQQKLNVSKNLFGVLVSDIVCGFIFYYTIKKENRIENEVKEINNKPQITYALIIKILLISLIFEIIGGEIVKGFQYVSGIDLTGDYAKMMDAIIPSKTILSIVCITLIGPIVEELLFRGIVYKRASRIMPIHKANLFQAILFGGTHFNLAQLIDATAFGYIAGLMYSKYDTCLVSILFHIFANVWSMVLP